MKNTNINQQEVLLSFDEKAFLLNCQRFVIENKRLNDRVGELEKNAALDKIEIAQYIADYNDIFRQLQEQKQINQKLRAQQNQPYLRTATNY